MKFKKYDQSAGTSVFLKKGNKNIHRRRYGGKVWSRDLRNGHSEPATPGDPAHIYTHTHTHTQTVTDTHTHTHTHTQLLTHTHTHTHTHTVTDTHTHTHSY